MPTSRYLEETLSIGSLIGLKTKARHEFTFFTIRKVRRTLSTAGLRQKRGHLEKMKYFWSSTKHFFYIVFTCVYLKGMRVFNTVHWEGHNSDIYIYFFVCLLQTFLMSIMSGVKGGGCHLCLNTFLCYPWNKSCGWKSFVALDAENRLCESIQAATAAVVHLFERTCRLFIFRWCWG